MNSTGTKTAHTQNEDKQGPQAAKPGFARFVVAVMLAVLLAMAALVMSSPNARADDGGDYALEKAARVVAQADGEIDPAAPIVIGAELPDTASDDLVKAPRDVPETGQADSDNSLEAAFGIALLVWVAAAVAIHKKLGLLG
jgi:hypothetical protein